MGPRDQGKTSSIPETFNRHQAFPLQRRANRRRGRGAVARLLRFSIAC
jgi:hypothetical protein